MSLRRFRRQYEQMSQFERGRMIGMMEARWSARRVARQLGRSDSVVKRCWDQWIREMSYTRRSDLGLPQQTSPLSRRLSHRKKCTLTVNCFIGRHPGTGCTFIRGPCVFSNHTKALV
ncbi:uncharacterized protein TNCV_2169671 [Trichonephila clavipes]|nr:uncharacterized protein TNCV_2169671 [Trichonephila clavipes]